MALARVVSLAYGSNLHPFRLTQRVRSATPIGVVPMPGKRLAFHKKSDDGSGKCLFYEPGGAEGMMYDKVGQFVVFDIGGNKFRLIVVVHFNRKRIYVRAVLTHEDYDQDQWKNE